MAIIYCLLCPFGRQVRYIGKTDAPLAKRLRQHTLYAARSRDHKAQWIKSLIAKGKTPLIEPLVRTGDLDWKAAERFFIASCKALGFELVNGTEGGEGLANPTKEVRSRMSESHIRHLSKPGVKQALADATRSLWQDAEYRNAMVLARTKIAETEAGRARLLRASAAAKERLAQDPDAAAALADKRRALWADEGYADRMRATRAAAWADPEIRAARLAKSRATKATRQAESSAKESGW